jgi:dipeptidyl aminopeptidase/acylaminoacyl peptidase
MGVKFGAALLAAAAAAPVYAQGKEAALFGARENVRQISLSPDGTHIAMIMPAGGRGANVVVVDIAGGGKLQTVMRTSGDPTQVTDCHWSTDIRLVCAIATVQRDGALVGYTRLFSLNRDGSDTKLLSASDTLRSLAIAQDGGRVIDWTADGSPGSVLATRSFVPESTIDTRLARTAQGLGVERLDTTTLRRAVVAPARRDAVEYISDGRGVVRIMGVLPKATSTTTGDTISYQYTMPGSGDWRPLSDVVMTPSGSTGFDPYAVDPSLNVAYGFDTTAGRKALYKVALDGSLKRELVLSRPDVDVDALLRIGRQQRVVGVSYVTERRETEFFDAELRRLGKAFGKALPRQPLITFVDASANEGKLLMFAGSDNDPGTYYLFDKATRKLETIVPARAELADVKLGTVKPLRFPAADGTMIPAYLTLPPGSDGKGLPAIVMPHGGPSARDEWGFDWLAQYFANRGFAVLQPNYRGSSGYGSEWFQKNGFQSWRTAIGDVNDAGRWLVTQGIADPARLAIVGWSYGGYAALQSAVIDPGLFKAVVAIAPVTDLDLLREEARPFTNYKLVSDYIGSGPHVAAGSPARHAGRITVPVLLFHGDRDQNVGVRESRTMADRLKDAGGKVEYVEFKGLGHQLDDSEARTTMLGKADSFLRAAWAP